MDTFEVEGVAEGTVDTPPEAVESPEVTELVVRAQRGEAGGFEGLLLLFERQVISMGVHMGLSRDDALDACQDTFLKVFRYIHRFRTGEAFFKWLYRIAVHSVYDTLRKTRSPGVVSLEDLEPGEAGGLRDGLQSPLERVELADLASKLAGSLGCLTRQERTVFVLRDMQQMGTERIAAILGLSPITIRRHCMTARLKLRDRLLPGKSTER